MATVEKYARRAGHWRIAIQLGPDHDTPPDANGRRKYRRRRSVICPASCNLGCSPYPHLRARTKAEAQAIAERLEADARGWGDTDPRIAAIAERWLATKTLAANTRHSYTAVVRNHIGPAFGHVYAHDLTVAMIADWSRELGADKPATAERCLIVLRQILGRAVEERHIAVNPATAVKRPPRSVQRPTIPALDDYHTLLDGLRTHQAPHWLVALVIIAANTGMRRGELAGLRWSRVDLEAGVLTVDTAVDRWRTIKDTKTHNVRTVPLSPPATEALTALAAVAVEEARTAGGLDVRDPDPEWFVFGSDRDPSEPRNPDAIGRQLQRLRERHDLPAVKLHALRHRFASVTYAGTGNLLAAAKLLGHADGSMIERVYGHALDDDLVAGVAALDY